MSLSLTLISSPPLFVGRSKGEIRASIEGIRVRDGAMWFTAIHPTSMYTVGKIETLLAQYSA